MLNYAICGNKGAWRHALYIGMALFALHSHAQAGQFDNAVGKTTYTPFCGDMNGDGQLDVLLKAAPKVLVVTLDDDFIVPLSLPPNSPSFTLVSNGGGYSLQANPDSATANSSAWRTGCHQLVVGDVLGTGAGSILIKANSPDLPSFVVAMDASTGTLRLTQHLSIGAIGTNLGAQGTTVELKDANGDGRSDLHVSANGRLQAVLIADATGAFHIDTSNTLVATWRRMLAGLEANNADMALSYIAAGSRDKYGQAFNELGTGMKQIPASLGELTLVKVSSRYATAVVNRNLGGTQSLHYVTFLQNGSAWEIAEF